jgi:hypothetical protein
MVVPATNTGQRFADGVLEAGERGGEDVGGVGDDMTGVYNEGEASGVAWFGEIPLCWRSAHLKRFTTRIQAGTTPPTNTPEYYLDGTIPWFAPGSFNGDIDLREPRKLINELALIGLTISAFWKVGCCSQMLLGNPGTGRGSLRNQGVLGPDCTL